MTVTVPQLAVGPKNVTGLQVMLDPDWLDNFGYRPVKVFVTVVATAGQERDLAIRLTSEPVYYQRGLTQAVTGRVVIPSGAAVGQVFLLTLTVPQCPPWYSAKLEVLEDGRPWEQLTATGVMISSSGSPYGSGTRNQIASLSYQPSQGVTTSIGTANVSFRTADLPTRWLDYTGVEVAFSSVPELEDLIQNFPAQATALRHWMTTGGILCVKGLDDDWNDLAKVEKLFPLKKADRWSTLDKWQPHFQAILTMEKPLSDGGDPLGIDISPETIRVFEQRKKEIAAAIQSSRVSEFGMGLIFATNNSMMDYGSSWVHLWGQGSSPYQIEEPSRTNWEARHGIAYEHDNGDFWNFLIPGVGFAPVWQFLTLITLFVVVVGPVNYYLLKKWKRIPLLLLTVPTAAAIVTVCLIGYAFLSDGLGVRVRTRSYTEIDQSTGAAVCWSRLSYYAGMAPANGLTFHDDTAVYPLPAWSLEQDETGRTHRETIWDGDKQKLVSGWLNSRTPTQFITVRARHTPARLNVQATADGSAVKVNNLLGTRIQELLVVDEAGKVFTGKDIAADKIATLDTPDAAIAETALRELIDQHTPQIPPEVADSQNSGNWGSPGFRNNFYPKASNNDNLPPVTQGTSRMETTIARLREKLRWGKFEPRTYIAIVDRSPEVEIGLDSARDEDSFHIIVGKW